MLTSSEIGSRDKSADLKQEQLYNDELKVQAEADYMADVIKQRQDDLDNVEQLMGDINDIAKQINTNVHEQRKDLEDVAKDVDTAK